MERRHTVPNSRETNNPILGRGDTPTSNPTPIPISPFHSREGTPTLPGTPMHIRTLTRLSRGPPRLPRLQLASVWIVVGATTPRALSLQSQINSTTSPGTRTIRIAMITMSTRWLSSTTTMATSNGGTIGPSRTGASCHTVGCPLFILCFEVSMAPRGEYYITLCSGFSWNRS